MSSSGDFCRRENMSVHSLVCAMGRAVLEKKKAPTLMSATRKMRGRMMRNSEMPAAFMAVSSKFSPRLPKVISEANRMASGSPSGTMVNEA